MYNCNYSLPPFPGLPKHCSHGPSKSCSLMPLCLKAWQAFAVNYRDTFIWVWTLHFSNKFIDSARYEKEVILILFWPGMATRFSRDQAPRPWGGGSNPEPPKRAQVAERMKNGNFLCKCTKNIGVFLKKIGIVWSFLKKIWVFIEKIVKIGNLIE